MAAEEDIAAAVTPKKWRVPLKGDLVSRYISVIEHFDRLPDSMNIEMEVGCAVEGISVPTGWRWSKAGIWPKIVNGRINVGDLRRMRAQAAAASKKKRRLKPKKSPEAVAA